jgi:predicted secreted protein
MLLGPFTTIAIYIVCWWVVLFIVLPLGMSQTGKERPTDGGDWGAPAEPNLKRKFITTTWVSAIAWLVVMTIIWTGIMPLPNLPGV